MIIVFPCDNSPEFKSDIRVETRRTQQNASTITKLLWKSLAKTWQNSLLKLWMLRVVKILIRQSLSGDTSHEMCTLQQRENRSPITHKIFENSIFQVN